MLKKEAKKTTDNQTHEEHQMSIFSRSHEPPLKRQFTLKWNERIETVVQFPVFFKIASFVLSRGKELIQVWNDMRERKWWQDYLFWANCAFKTHSHLFICVVVDIKAGSSQRCHRRTIFVSTKKHSFKGSCLFIIWTFFRDKEAFVQVS